MTVTRPPLFASLFTAAGIVILLSLGFWQIERLEWKENLLSEINSKLTAEPEILGRDDFENSENRFKKGIIYGNLLYDKEIALGPRTYDGRPGNHIYTPLELRGGGTILVNRGWAPLDYEIGSTPDPQPDLEGNAEIALLGIVRKPPKGNSFTPDNAPEKGQWYQINFEQIEAVKNLPDLAPMIFALYEESAGDIALYPAPQALDLKISNNHLYYAVFWFTMAGVLFVIYVLRFALGKDA